MENGFASTARIPDKPELGSFDPAGNGSQSVKRGRPRKNGRQPLWMFGRAARILYVYNEARKSGIKHSCAVRETVAALKNENPDMPISETEVKRVLAKFQPRGARIVFRVTKGPAQPLPAYVAESRRLPPGIMMKTVFTFGLGPRPEYPRP